MPFSFLESLKTTIITAPFSGGQSKSGVEDGPKYLLRFGLQAQLKELGWETFIDEPLKGKNFEDLKDDSTDVFENCKHPKIVGEATKLIYESVKLAIFNNTLPLTIGGDHSIAIGTVAGSFTKYPNAGLIWVDAHADINTPKTTISGNLHGCPVSFLMGLDSEFYPPELQWVPKVLKPNKIVYIGLRDVDPMERKFLQNLGIVAFSMYHIDKFGINKVIEMALEAIDPNNENCPIHLSYDVDAIDPQFVPATGTPVHGGLTLREGLFIGERLAETGKLIALDIVECNPSLGVNEVHIIDTIAAGAAIARCAMGETVL
ncbi:hypothetical protein WICMUC_000195 [Wickerhamomyces mucosus]|uniref:Arginase n=1 Tax=Wickerhamomyces mucosus TaxID=1378264 RepID=A0A9P8PY61_9ASCO|nr:hypothetical protein WICMUC_000195 [Wickerhamomyces mucosus]